MVEGGGWREMLLEPKERVSEGDKSASYGVWVVWMCVWCAGRYVVCRWVREEEREKEYEEREEEDGEGRGVGMEEGKDRGGECVRGCWS